MQKNILGIVIAIAVIIVFLFVGGMGVFNNFITDGNNMNQVVNGSIVTVHYTGVFENGTKFDSSRDRGEPFSFVVGKGQVIKGWDEGLLGMKIGDKKKLVVPPEKGYGPNDYGPIPGGSTLIFEIEVLDIQ